jgi:hypothetical protein
MKVRTAYILWLIEETKDEVREVIYAVFSDRKEAKGQGEGLVSLSDNKYVDHYISECVLFD